MDQSTQKAVFQAVMAAQLANAPLEYEKLEGYDRLIVLSHHFHQAGIPVRIQTIKAYLPWHGSIRYASGLSLEGDVISVRGLQSWHTIMDEDVKTYDIEYGHRRPKTYDFDEELEEDHESYLLGSSNDMHTIPQAHVFVSALVSQAIAFVDAKRLEQSIQPAFVNYRGLRL
jgi:hypothetical protein